MSPRRPREGDDPDRRGLPAVREGEGVPLSWAGERELGRVDWVSAGCGGEKERKEKEKEKGERSGPGQKKKEEKEGVLFCFFKQRDPNTFI